MCSIGVSSENARFVVLMGCPKRFGFFVTSCFNRLVAYSTLSNAYFSRFGDFRAHDNNDNDDDRTDYFTSCACMRGNNISYHNPAKEGPY